MTSFPSSDGPRGRLGRDGGTNLPRLGIDRSLIAPGETPSVNSGGVARAEQLAGFLDSMTGLGGTYLQLRAQKAEEAARLADQMREEDARVAEAAAANEAVITKQKRGLGERDARAKLPLIQQEIAGDTLQIPDGADPVEFTRSYLEEQFAGVDPDYQDAAVALIENDVVKAFTDRKAEHAKVAVKDTHNLLGEWAVDKTPAEVEATIGEAMRYPGAQNLPEQEIRASVVGPAMKVAVKDGDVARVNALAPLLGDQAQAAIYAEQARTNEAQARKARHAAGYDAYALKSADKGVATSVLRRDLEELQKNDAIDPQTYRSEVRALDERDQKALDEAKKDALIVEEAEIKQKANEDARSMIRSGLGSLIRQQKVSRSDGKEISLYENADIDAAFNAEFARIAAANPNPDVAESEQLKLAAFNGYMPPAIEQVIKTGALASTEANFLEAAASGKRDNLPPLALPGYVAAKKLKSQQGGLYARVSMNERERDLYDIAMTVQELSGVKDEDALFEAAKAVARPRPPQMGDEERGIFRKQVNKYASSGGIFGLFDSPPKNAGEVASDIQRLSEVYMRGGKPMQQAVEQAAKEVGKQRASVNGWSINMNNAALPQDLKENINVVSKQIIDNWVRQHGEATGYDASDLTLAPSKTTGIWQLTIGANGMSVPVGDIQDRFFDTTELMDLLSVLKPAPSPANVNSIAQNVAGQQREGQAAVVTAANAPASIGLGEPLAAPSWQSQYERYFRK